MHIFAEKSFEQMHILVYNNFEQMHFWRKKGGMCMFLSEKHMKNCVNGKKSMRIVTVFCWKAPDEWENR